MSGLKFAEYAELNGLSEREREFGNGLREREREKGRNGVRADLGSEVLLPPAIPHVTIAGDDIEGTDGSSDLKPKARFGGVTWSGKDGVGQAASDTPLPSNPSSPKIPFQRNTSASSTPRVRPTTLDIPGLTKSKVSPDGRISQRDVGSKLVIVMVGLPARGKSYITKKVARYLNWLQHDARIFNVGEKRRIYAHHDEVMSSATERSILGHEPRAMTPTQVAAHILINGEMPSQPIPTLSLNGRVSPQNGNGMSQEMANLESAFPDLTTVSSPGAVGGGDPMDQTADFFDPQNTHAALIREQCAMETLDDLLHFILEDGGSVGILDATNSTLARRKLVMERIRAKAGPALNVLFIESVCEDEALLESNMRLKLSGPDYKDKDPIASLEDFRKRVAIYEKNYVPIGEYEEKNNMPYVKMIDVGRKVISHQIHGFLSAQAVYYLLNFNLAPRQIWITRHGESADNQAGKIGGDSSLTENGRRYAAALTRFIEYERKAWDVRQRDKEAHTHFPPHPGDHTPPNPHFTPQTGDGNDPPEKNFCVWTSMLKRSIQSGELFDEEEFDVKQMRMLDELNAGDMEGMTYDEIKIKHLVEYELRQHDKLSYRYPGPGGEGYLDVINRLRPVIVELERMTDHCLLITHRSVARVLLAYFMGLRRDQVADLDCPLGMLYSLEPKPYGVEFKAFKYNSASDWFGYLPDFELKKAAHPHN
ncbi:bifunctional 6-phosphofructo-2-kinase/fructose-2,6-bisphosphate 2-phosphatase [Tothia fuscella]|uniref:Bifunctional 6-phosphofructo-2-kinase/fructose-2,6-bisphosphate 2-phosphatase n=1 Tax=Tothia fuscella TaxID=1048955 RepID=A0A9P4NNE9_9PEZI|nr:bifunctional 6-phosphofructo-2-kinase/fructose-2,6-bisphosphate 2-phosphatase [Tothia fuscella]